MFLSDEPITDATEDRLGRSTVVDGLYQAISGWAGDSSLVIGLYGAWGEGKTSVKNLLRNKLMEDERFLVVDFDSWYFNTTEALIQNFLTAIVSCIEKHVDGPTRTALKAGTSGLRRVLTSLPLTGVSAFGFGVSFDPSKVAEQTPTLQQLRRELESVVSNLEKRVVILVDDLDRLGREEVRIAFKLIKLWTSFSNFIYVLPFDRRTVQEKLKEEVEADPRFLEKMVQIDVNLPAIERATLDQFMTDYMNQLGERYEFSFERDFDERFGRIWREGVQHLITDLRTAKRYVNALAFTIPLVRGEVNYADFFGLEAFRLHFPATYEDVGSNRQFFTSVSLTLLGAAELAEKERTAFFDGLITRGAGEDRKKILSAILSGIFPLFENHVRKVSIGYQAMSQEWSREQRATSERCFNNYFVMAIRPGQVSDAWVRALIRSLNESSRVESTNVLQGAIRDMKGQGKLKAFLDSLVVFESDVDVERVDAVADAIAGTSDLLEYVSAPFSDTDFDVAIRLVFLMAARVEETEAVGQLLDKVVRTSTVAFGATLVSFSEPQHNDILRDFTHVSQERLIETLRQRFKTEYADTDQDIFKDVQRLGIRVLYQLRDKEMVTEYLIAIIGRDPPGVMEQLGESYVRDWAPRRRMELSVNDLDNLVDVERLHEVVKHVELPEDASERARWFVNLLSGDGFRKLLQESRAAETTEG